MVSWTLCGSVAIQDSPDFLRQLDGELQLHPDILLFQECGHPQALEASRSGYQTFADDRHRGNCVLLSNRLARGVCFNDHNASTTVVAIKGENRKRHVFASAHLPTGGSQSDYEVALEELYALIAKARGGRPGLLVLGINANAQALPCFGSTTGHHVS